MNAWEMTRKRSTVSQAVAHLPIVAGAVTIWLLPYEDNLRLFVYAIAVLPATIVTIVVIRICFCGGCRYGRLILTVVLSIVAAAVSLVLTAFLGLIVGIFWIGCPSGWEERTHLVPLVFTFCGFLASIPALYMNYRKAKPKTDAQPSAQPGPGSSECSPQAGQPQR